MSTLFLYLLLFLPDHFANVTEGNQETDSSLQGEAQEYSRPDEQQKNAHITDEQLGNLTGFTDSDLPAPEKVLAVPNGLGDGTHFMVESTPDKEDPGTCNEDAGNNNITGKKRTFTESTLTAESLNSVESVGLIQSKRTVDSVPDDDDLLSSILGISLLWLLSVLFCTFYCSCLSKRAKGLCAVLN